MDVKLFSTGSNSKSITFSKGLFCNWINILRVSAKKLCEGRLEI